LRARDGTAQAAGFRTDHHQHEMRSPSESKIAALPEGRAFGAAAGAAVASSVLVALTLWPGGPVPAAVGWVGALGLAWWAGRSWPSRGTAARGPERPPPTFGPGYGTLALVAERTTSSVVITDAIGRIDWVNEAFTQMTGYALGEALGQWPGRLLQGPETDPGTIARFRAGLAGRKSFEIEILNYRKDGRPYLVHMTIDPVFDTGGRLQHFIAIQMDVTARRRQEIMNAGVLAHAAHAIIATDANGVIEIFNPGAEQLIGRAAAGMIGQASLTSLHDPDELVERAAELGAEYGRVVLPGLESVVLKARETGRAEEREWNLLHRDGRRMPVRCSVSLFWVKRLLRLPGSGVAASTVSAPSLKHAPIGTPKPFFLR
jgi:PAS domain S-box-containing protein